MCWHKLLTRHCISQVLMYLNEVHQCIVHSLQFIHSNKFISATEWDGPETDTDRRTNHLSRHTFNPLLDSWGDFYKWPNVSHQDLLRPHHICRKVTEQWCVCVCVCGEWVSVPWERERERERCLQDDSCHRFIVTTGCPRALLDTHLHTYAHTHSHKHTHTRFFQPPNSLMCRWHLTDRWRGLRVDLCEAPRRNEFVK